MEVDWQRVETKKLKLKRTRDSEDIVQLGDLLAEWTGSSYVLLESLLARLSALKAQRLFTEAG
jgi:hypothetical protein